MIKEIQHIEIKKIIYQFKEQLLLKITKERKNKIIKLLILKYSFPKAIQISIFKIISYKWIQTNQNSYYNKLILTIKKVYKMEINL